MRRSIVSCRLAACFFAVAMLFAANLTPAAAQVELTRESYLQPPSPILDSVTAPWHTNKTLRNMAPDGVRFLLPKSEGMTPLDAISTPHARLAESDFEHEARRSRRLYTRSDAGLEIFNAETGETTAISIPDGARVSNATWSRDGSQIAYFAHFLDETHIYMAYADSGESRQLTQRPVVATHVTNYEWTADGSKIVTVLSPESEQISMPVEGPVPTEPTIRITREGETRSRTYRYLLQSPYEMALLEYVSTGQVALIGIDDGQITTVGEAEMIRSLDADPSGSYFRVSMMKRPFSYFVPMSSFGTTEVLIDSEGKVLHTFSDRDLREGGGGGRGGRGGANNDDDDNESPRRDIRWRPGAKGFSFLQRPPSEQDEEEADNDDQSDNQNAGNNAGRRGGGRAGRGALQGRRGRGAAPQTGQRRGRGGRGEQQGQQEQGQQEPQGPDRVMLWKPPFGDDDVDLVFESPTAIRSVAYSQDGRWMFLTRAAGRNQQTIHAFDLQNDNAEYLVFRGRGGGGGGGGRGGRGRGGRGTAFDPIAAANTYDWDVLADETWASTINPTYDAQIIDEENLHEGLQDGNGQQGDGQQQQDDQQQTGDQQQGGRRGRGQGRGRGRRGGGNQDAATQTGDANQGDGDANQDDADANQDDADSAQDDGDSPQDDNQPEETRGATRGTLMTTTSIDGERVVRVSSNGDVYFSYTDSEEEEEEDEDQPDDGEQDEESTPPERTLVIEKVNILSGEVEKVFESEPMELTVSMVASGGTDELDHFYTSRQSTENPPDFFMYVKGESAPKRLTNNKNFTPWFQKLETERFQVTRVDGFKFWVTVTKNPDHGEKLPAMFWFYPREYTDQAAYDRGARGGRGGGGRGGPGRFRQPSSRSMAHLTQVGYVIVEPDLPIVGPEGRMNDNFVQDLRNGLWAVIDECDKRDIIDRDRLGIGGHSYGAFGTANALAHTPFFKAGIAGDGNYNRTLTPMAFQSERRILWESRETYISMSPMFWANQINGALLMYHGAEDANVGTHTMHSEKMFHTLDGLGKPAAMYMYPYEDHGPIARETTLDMWARWVAWLDKYVKNPAQPEEAEEEADEDVAEANGR